MRVFFFERLKYARVTRPIYFLHTNFHRAKIEICKACTQSIRLVQGSNEREFPKLFCDLSFFVVNPLLFKVIAGFMCLGRLSGIATIKALSRVARETILTIKLIMSIL
jgi:hypothetical protein